MRLLPVAVIVAATVLTILSVSAVALEAAEPPDVTAVEQPGSWEIRVGGQLVATYVYRHPQTLRPYFTNVRSPSGIQATRHHPPRPGQDSTDHTLLHPGIWLAFGDVSGEDFWRNKAKVEHVEFVERPVVRDGGLTFKVRNRYVADGSVICEELCRHRFLVRPAGYLLLYDSEFQAVNGEIDFGDQEEMGLGFRVAAGLRVKGGNGRILASDGGLNEKQIRGTDPNWIDYSGEIDGQTVGLMVMPDPRNFRRCWYHARDYGFATANPFGRNALTGGEKSQVTVKPGGSLRLRFGVLIHSSPSDKPIDLAAAYADYLEQVK